LKNALMVLSPPDLGKQLAEVGLDAALLADVIAEAGQHAGWRGMSMLQLPSSLTDLDPMNVILRQHTLDVNDVALKHLTLKGAGKGPAVLITGSPGIGKSMSSLPALVRGLALGQAGPAPPVIIIELRQLSRVFKLTFNVDPASGIATGVASAESIHISKFLDSDEPALQDPSTVYIVDPTSRGGSMVGSPADVRARTVVIASPNSDHYKDFEKRRPSPLSLYLEHWTLEEVLAARPYISRDVTEQEVVERWQQQGGNPRVVFDTADSFMKAREKTNIRLGVMPQEVLRRIYLKTGSLQLEEKGDKDPNSAVVTYVRSSPPFNAPTVGFLSNAVRRLVGAYNAEGVLALLHRATPSARSAMALDFEAVAIKLIAEGRTFRITALPVGVKLKGSKSVVIMEADVAASKSADEKGKWPLPVEVKLKKTKVEGLKTMVEVARVDTSRTFAPFPIVEAARLGDKYLPGAGDYATQVTSFLIRNQRTVDAVGPGKVAYQVTMAGTHDVNETGLHEVVEVLGASREEPLRLCFLVPQDAYETWQKKKFIVVPEALADRVRAYAVLIKV